MLTQVEADRLIAAAKSFKTSDKMVLGPRSEFVRPLVEKGGHEEFLLDVWQGGVAMKARLQTRARKVVVLVRVDLGLTQRHTNPDGERIVGPHIHVYREGFEDKFAKALPVAFTRPGDLAQTLAEFCTYCSIDGLPHVQASLAGGLV